MYFFGVLQNCQLSNLKISFLLIHDKAFIDHCFIYLFFVSEQLNKASPLVQMMAEITV